MRSRGSRMWPTGTIIRQHEDGRKSALSKLRGLSHSISLVHGLCFGHDCTVALSPVAVTRMTIKFFCITLLQTPGYNIKCESAHFPRTLLLVESPVLVKSLTSLLVHCKNTSRLRILMRLLRGRSRSELTGSGCRCRIMRFNCRT